MPAKPKQSEGVDVNIRAAEDFLHDFEDEHTDVEESATLDLEGITANTDEAAFLASLDDEVDAEDVARKQAEIYLPKGLYVWKEQPEIEARYLSNDKRNTDRTTKGRELWNVFGTVIHTETKQERQFRFNFSPDRREIPSGNRKGEVDNFSQTYAKLTTYYRKKFAETHKSHRALYDFVKSGDYAFYLTQSAGGNFLGQFQNKPTK